MIEAYDIGCEPSPSVPSETLLQDGWNTFLLFWAVSKDIDPISGYLKDLGIAILECKGTVMTRFGYPNDEGLPEHPLYKHGLQDLSTSVAVISPSKWILDINAQRQASAKRIWGDRYIPPAPSHDSLHHFIICLKEATFECLAESLVIVDFVPDFDQAYQHVIQRFNQH